MICKTYLNTDQLILHDPIGACKIEYNINFILLSKQVCVYKSKISEFNKLLKIHPHNCSIKINVDGHHYMLTNHDQIIDCKITFSHITQSYIQLFMTQLDVNQPYAIDLYFSSDPNNLQMSNINSMSNTYIELPSIDDDYIDSIKLNISNGVAKIENLHPTYIESESESDSDTDSNSDIIFKLQCIIM